MHFGLRRAGGAVLLGTFALTGCFADTALNPVTETGEGDTTTAADSEEGADESIGSGDGDGTGDGDGDGSVGDGDGSAGDGDGTTSSGDGDGDGTTSSGDGDGDGTTSVGDGDGTTSVGDGDGTTSAGDGDGDGTTSVGDGDGTTSAGDGDGDGTTSVGDGDGDGTTSVGDGDGTTSIGDGDGTTSVGDGDGTTSVGDGDGDGTTSIGDGDGTTSIGDGDGTTSVGDGDGDGDGTALFPATGIDITLVEANQGVGIYIGSGASWVSAASRLARLIAGRETLVRIHHSVHGDWIPREVEAQLEIQRQDLTTVTYTDRRTIFGDSIASDLSSSFSFELDCAAGDCEAGTDYQVSFWDVDTPGPQSPGVNLNPSSAPAPVGFEALDLELRMVFVPLEYVPLGTIPDLNPAWMDGIADSIYQQTPTTSVTYEVRPVEQVTDPITFDLIPAWQVTGNVYFAGFPQPNEFYVGVIDPQISPPLSGLAAVGNNYNAIQYVPSPIEFAKSVVHETGHNHGLMHVDCASWTFPPGQADENFPTHPDATLESGGWGVLDKLYRPADTHTDYMSYCTPAWTSAYHWDRVMSNLVSVNPP